MDRVDILSRRAQRLRAKGEHRKAANTYGELTSVEPTNARWWVLLAITAYSAHRVEVCVKACRQAAYLFRQRGERARDRSLARWVDAHGELSDRQAA